MRFRYDKTTMMTLLMTAMAALIPFTASGSRSLRRTRPIDVPESIGFRLPGNLSDVVQAQGENAPGRLDYLLGTNFPGERQQGIGEGPFGEIIAARSSAYARAGKKGSSKKSSGRSSPMDCTSPTTPFDSLVLVRFDGNPAEVSNADVRFLEITFQETYNDLISTICDDENRLVVGVSSITQQGSELIRNGGLSYSIKFAVDLTCRMCENTTATAFAPPDYDERNVKGGKKGDKGEQGKHGKRMEEKVEGDSKGEGIYRKGGARKGEKIRKGEGGKSGKGGKGVGSGCNCYSSHPQSRPPTEREFQTAFNANLQAGMSRRYLQARKTAVTNVFELAALPCASPESIFKTYVAVQFDGEPPSSVEDIVALEQGFVESYNGLSEVQCDPFFRRVLTATMQEDSLVEIGIQRYMVRYMIRGTCRGCESDSNLFLSESDRAAENARNNRQLQMSTPFGSPCFCPTFKPPNQPPTEKAFTLNYAHAINDLRELGALQGETSVRLVKELDEVECPGRLNNFDSVVIVDHMVFDSPVPKQELSELEGAFITAYNRVNSFNFKTCDPVFRSVKGVIVLIDGPSNLNRPLPDGQVRLTYIVEAECRGCTSNTNLFDFPTSAARAAGTGRVLQTSDDLCFCPTNSQITRGPSSLEFRQSFDAIIEELAGEGVVATVEDPKKVLEVDEEACSVSVNPLKSTVYVDFNADTSLLTPSDIAIVEQAFRNSYNDLIETFCDPILRNVLNARVSEENFRVSSSVSTVRFTFLVDGRCRGCQAGTTIFHSDDGVADVVSRHLAESNVCFCATGNPKRRGATVGEFEMLYDKRIRRLKNLGKLQGIKYVERVVEATQPTTAPISGPPTFPVSPVAPIAPVTPVSPVAPSTPVSPVSPETPVSPVSPETPVSPVAPSTPVSPVSPETPVSPVAPSTPVSPVSPETPVSPVSPETPVSPVSPSSPVSPVSPVAIFPTSEPSSTPSGSSFPSTEPSLASSSAVTSSEGQFGGRKLAQTPWYYRHLLAF